MRKSRSLAPVASLVMMGASEVRHYVSIFVIVVTATVLAQGACPSGWSMSPSGYCYQFIETSTSFYKCLDLCHQRDASLACIRNGADNTFLKDLLMFDDDSRGPAYIGLTDGLEEGSWQWVATGCASTFYSWANPEHGGKQDPSEEDCVSMPPWHDLAGSTWDDENCQCSRGCICEYGATTKHEFAANLTQFVQKPVIECHAQSFVRLFILAGICLSIFCITVVSTWLCYRYKRCCWQANTAPVANWQGGTPMVIGQPVQGQTVQVASTSQKE